MGWNTAEVGLSGLKVRLQIPFSGVKEGPKLLFLLHKHSYLDHLQKCFLKNYGLAQILLNSYFFLAVLLKLIFVVSAEQILDFHPFLVGKKCCFLLEQRI